MPAVSTRPFSVSVSPPLETARGPIATRRGWLLRPADGIGLGEATPLPGWTEPAPVTALALAGATQQLRRGQWDRALATTAGTPAARHGVSLLRLDRAARRAGVPLAAHLADGGRTDRVPVNAVVGDGDPERTAQLVAAAVTNGFECVKVKVGARSLAADRRRLATVRDRVGPDLTLRVDANGAWDRETAGDALEILAAFDVSLVEQPLPSAEIDGLANLRGGPVDIAADEALSRDGPGPAAVVEKGAADVLILKPMVLGGIDRAIAVAKTARACDMEVLVTTTVDAVVARTAALHLSAALECDRHCGLATAGRLDDDLGPDPAPIADGWMTVPTDPGIGIERTTGES